MQASPNSGDEPLLLEARGITKHFGAVTALEGVSLTLSAGEVLGVVGDNGAGKSTLMKVLSGLIRPSEGEMLFQGQPVHFHSPARRAQGRHRDGLPGPRARREHADLREHLSRPRARAGTLPGSPSSTMRRSRKLAADHLDRLQIHVKSVDQNVEDLSGGQRQAVAIARATAFDAKVVIMDEPTAALAIKEVGKVLDLIKRLKDHDVGVILISHRMDDVFYVCDRVMAIFRGRNFAESPLKDTSRNEVIGWIMGTKGHSAALAHDKVH